MDNKWVITILLLIVSLIAVYTVFIKTYSIDDLFNRKEISYNKFIDSLQQANGICIIFNYTSRNDVIKHNVAQCATDLSYSYVKTFNKSVYIYGIEDNRCYNEGRNTTISECVKEVLMKNCVIFYIENSNKTAKTYDNLLYIPIGKDYSTKCSIGYH